MFASFSHLILYFVGYGVLGWMCETLYCSVPSRRFVKRGFLRGPCCPIYGVGALAILWIGRPVIHSPFWVLALSMLAASVLEYIASWGLEKLFQVRWWDYTGKKFQLNGRVRLKNSLLFGALGLVVTYLVHPRMSALVDRVPAANLRIVANGVLAVFLLDLITTIGRLMGFSQRLAQLQADLQELRNCNKQYGWFDGRDLEGSLERLRALDLPALERNPWILRLESVLERKKAALPQLEAYKSARSHSFAEAWDAVRNDAHSRRRTGRWHLVRRKTKSAGVQTAAAGRTAARTIWNNLRYYQLFWVFLTAGVLGYLVETLYCLLTTGGIESRQGLLYGPFNQVYGFGAVFMVLALVPLAKKNDRWVFAGSALLGGAFETLCSWIQEKVFGSVSWQYEEQAFSMAGGRTSLLFMFFWGVLGLVFIKGMYPKLLSFIQRIPPKTGKVMTAVLSVLLVWNMLLSAAAVVRWSQRIAGEDAHGRVEQYLDQRYPDDFMQTVYPNMLWPEPEAS